MTSLQNSFQPLFKVFQLIGSIPFLKSNESPSGFKPMTSKRYLMIAITGITLGNLPFVTTMIFICFYYDVPFFEIFKLILGRDKTSFDMGIFGAMTFAFLVTYLQIGFKLCISWSRRDLVSANYFSGAQFV